MSVNVRFPDGSEREVPSRLTAQKSREVPDNGPTFTEVPLPDLNWDYLPVIGGWIARAKR